jgi:anti-sigma28 factor (negative regulator of flagellin synthesis)
MSQIGHIQPNVGLPPVPLTQTLQAKPSPQSVAEAEDYQVEFSEIAQYLSEIRDLPDVRTDKVAEVRAAIDRGDYETEEVINVTVDRLIEDLL